MGVLEAKGVGEGIGGGEIVVWGSAGSVWDKEAAHGVSAAGDDDGVGMGARRGTGAGYVRGDGVGTPIAAGGSRRTDGGCAGPRAGAVGGGGRVAVLESGGWIWVWFIAHGGVEGGEGGVEVGIVVLVDVLGVLLLLWGGGCGDVKDVVSVGVVVGGAGVGRSLVRGHVGCLDEVGEFVRKVDRLLGVGGVVGLGGEFAERLREKGDVVGHEQLVVAVVVGSGLWGRSVCGGWQLEAILSDERGICHRVRKEKKKRKSRVQEVLDQISFGVSVRLWEYQAPPYLFTIVYFPTFYFRSGPDLGQIEFDNSRGSRGSSHSLWHSLVHTCPLTPQNSNHIPTHARLADHVAQASSTWHHSDPSICNSPTRRPDQRHHLICITPRTAARQRPVAETMFHPFPRFPLAHRELRPDFAVLRDSLIRWSAHRRVPGCHRNMGQTNYRSTGDACLTHIIHTRLPKSPRITREPTERTRRRVPETETETSQRRGTPR